MATGSTPHKVGFWKELQARAARKEINFQHCTFVNPDEWIGLGPEHPEAYKTYLVKELKSHFPTTVLVPDGDAADPIAAAVEVEAAIEAAGGFAWMMLGMGINGHIGFFEPNADGLSSQPFLPEIDQINRERYAKDHFGSIEQVPTHATTIGLGTVSRAKETCLVVVGRAKAKLLANALTGPVSTALPASLVQLSSNATVFLDAEAASELDLASLGKRPGWRVIQEG